MGLCKCRAVTTFFCFEHRKNVCEQCIVADHPMTYLQWLQDCEFNPKCCICHQVFSTNHPAIRLPCLDLIHWGCLEREVLLKTGTGTLAGTNCPMCQSPLLPPPEASNSPIVNQMRQQLQGTRWANQLPIASIDCDLKKGLGGNGRGDEDRANFGINPNGLQPNGIGNIYNSNSNKRTEVVAIDMGIRPSFPITNNSKNERHPTATLSSKTPEPQSSLSVNSAWRIFLNFITLRNVRACGFGPSPRRLLIVFIIMAIILVFSFHFILPIVFPAGHFD